MAVLLLREFHQSMQAGVRPQRLRLRYDLPSLRLDLFFEQLVFCFTFLPALLLPSHLFLTHDLLDMPVGSKEAARAAAVSSLSWSKIERKKYPPFFCAAPVAAKRMQF